MELTEKLISLRRENGLTQLALAEKMEVSRQTISRWESGEAFPSSDNLRRLGELYGVSVGYLMSNDAEQLTTAVAVVEKLEPKKPWQKPVLIGVVIALIVALLMGTFFIGYQKGTKDTVPTYPVHTDILDENDFGETVDLIGW